MRTRQEKKKYDYQEASPMPLTHPIPLPAKEESSGMSIRVERKGLKDGKEEGRARGKRERKRDYQEAKPIPLTHPIPPTEEEFREERKGL